MGRLYYDIETIPATKPELVEHLKKTMKPPGNMSKPETIEKWLADPENVKNHVHSTSFDGAFGQILCIGYALDDGPIMVAKGGEGEDEKTAIKEFLTALRGTGSANKHTLIGHNIKKFDNRFLSQRMMLHGLGPLFKFGAKPWEIQAEDTMEMWMGDLYKDVKLENLCVALDIPTPKDAIDGSQVYQTWLDGNKELVFEYCGKDVEATRQVYKRMTGI